MCGIFAYTGSDEAAEILVDALGHLEYRGYDSAGIAVQNGKGIDIRRVSGRIENLRERVAQDPVTGTSGIAHTRWATHGAPTVENAHPHRDCEGRIAVVHNGIIENADELRARLEEEGHEFRSQTDTEVLAHLIEHHWAPPLHLAVARALSLVEGTYGIAVVSSEEPDRIVCARRGSPLMVAIGNDANFVTSDAAAVLPHTRRVIYLDDGEMGVIDPGGVDVISVDELKRVAKDIEEIEWDVSTVRRNGHPHFMLKEIYEQPDTLRETLRGRILDERNAARLGGLDPVAPALAHAKRVMFVACGTSWHAGLIGKYMIEDYTGIPAEVEYAAEWRYRNPVLGSGTVVVGISQSGETADTLAALKLAREEGATTIGIVNVVGSSMSRTTDAGIYLHAGPEIGVASTKAFTSQIAALALLTLYLGHQRSMDRKRAADLVAGLLELPGQAADVLESTAEDVEELATRVAGYRNCLYLGRGYGYPVALEGALKLKEISYVHAEGLSAAEMKHGPIALIDEEMPVVVVAPRDGAYDKVLSNIQEVRARGGRVIAVTTEPNGLEELAEAYLTVPSTVDCLLPVLTSIPLQLLAYHIGVERGCDVDKPRNLAKSVTVE